MNTFVQPSNNEINDQIEFLDHEIENLKSLISENHYMNPEQEDELEDLITKAIKFGELCGRRDQVQNPSDGFVVVPKKMPESFDEALYAYSNNISVVDEHSDGFIPMSDINHSEIWELVIKTHGQAIDRQEFSKELDGRI